MKKLNYIAPSTKVVVLEHRADIMMGSPNGTNLPGVKVWDDPAPADMEGRSRIGNPWNKWDWDEE